MAELFGKSTGISHGRGGSMHLFDQDLRFMGGYAIVGGGLPIACGLALAVSYNEGPEVVCCFFGDGALPQGAFHETLNMASLWKLPLVFICENNFYGMGTLVQNAISQEELYRFAEPYKMPGVRVDGMDVLDVYGATMEAVARARAGDGPSLIEAVTYRFRGHSMSDPAEYRSKREERIWQERDPIKNLRRRLLMEKRATESKLTEVENEVATTIDDAVKFADESPEPSMDELGKGVYASDDK
jgi:pyruvate dehydrogenase E1 component alpha subunit